MGSPSLTSTHVLKTDCERCEELEAQLERTQIAAEMDVAALGAQVAQMQREITRLKKQVADDKASHTAQDGEAYAYWLEVMGKSEAKCRFGESRKRALARARRAGLTQEDVLKVISAHARFPFLVFGRWAATGSQKDRKDDLTDAFKEEKRWEALLELADRPVAPPHVSQRREDHFNTLGQDRPLMNLYYGLERGDCNPYLSAGGQGSAHCPIHDDRERSFRFKEKADGGVVVYCFACSPGFVSGQAFCEQVRQDLQIPLSDLYPNRKDGR